MRALSLLVTMVAALLVVPASASASTATEATRSLCWMAPAPGTGWTGLPYYDRESCAECETVGAAGVADGTWEKFLCGFVPIGLDGIYRLHVPSTR